MPYHDIVQQILLARKEEMYMEPSISKKFLEKLSKQNEEFVLIGLTGRVRSGTSDVSKLLTSSTFKESVSQPANTEGYDMSIIREHKVIFRYLKDHWKPFIALSVTSVMVSFLLDSAFDDLDRYAVKNAENDSLTIRELLNICLEHKDFKVKVWEEFERTYNTILLHLRADPPKDKEKLQKEVDNCLGQIFSVDQLIVNWQNIKKEIPQNKYNTKTIVFCYGVLPTLAELIDDILGRDKNFISTFQDFGNNIRAYGKAIHNRNDTEGLAAKNLFVLPERLNQFIKVLRHYYSADYVSCHAGSDQNRVINPILIVINSFKNIFEAFYFRRRYSSFYLLAVSCDEKNRKMRFSDQSTYKLADLRENLASAKKLYKSITGYFEKEKDIESRLNGNWKSESEEKFKATTKYAGVVSGTNSHRNIIKKISQDLGIGETEVEFCLDTVFGDALRGKCYKDNLSPFILQDVMTCIENADIFLTRNYIEGDYKCDYPLIRSLARIITLILHPGLLTPTKIERCMQIAMAAKLNSGCLSRQVGAVVTDKEYNILSLGWNDAPCGVESCIRRNLFDLLRKHDPDAYSDYELHDETFRIYMDKVDLEVKKSRIKEEMKGLPAAFCFKDIYQDIIKQRDQIYTRALHGEERALAACGNNRTKDGYLFTTSSPCELCAKKAKEANISKIYYIEQYPGISHTHVIDAGPKENRAQYEFFVGAVGLAYVKLYTPLIPYKDELAAFGFTPTSIFEREIQKSAGDVEVSSSSGSTQSESAKEPKAKSETKSMPNTQVQQSPQQ